MMESQPRFTALILEPDVLQRSVIVRALARDGVQAVVCPGPDELAALVEEHQPDLLLIDAHLPQVNGLEVIAQLRRQQVIGSARVMVISSLAFPEVVQRAAVHRVDDFVVKPVQVEDFLARVRRLLHKGESQN